jgi:hypothetical protein
MVRRVAVFFGAAALLMLLALDGGGYDIVARQKVALVLWLLIAVGFAFRILPLARPDAGVLAPAVAALALLFWLVLALAWTESAERTGTEICRLLGYLGVLTLAIACLDRTTFRAAAGGVSVAAIGVVAISLSSRLFPDLFPGATDVSRLGRPDRLDFPLDYWNAVGAWSAMAIAIGLAWSAHARSEAVRALALSAVPACGLVLYLTYSRAAVAAAGVAVVATFLLSRNRRTAVLHALAAGAGTAVVILVVRGHPDIADATGGGGGVEVLLTLIAIAAVCAAAALATRRLRTDRPVGVERKPTLRKGPAVALLAGLAVVAAVLIAQGTFSDAWDEFRTDESADGAGTDPAARLTSLGGNRADLWDSAWASFEEHPLGGTGAGTFEFWWSRDARDPEFVRDAHSLYLEALAELGLPGFLLVVTLLGGSLVVAFRVRAGLRDPDDVAAWVAMVAVFIVFLVTAGVDWMWEETAVAVLALGAIAVAWSAGSTARAGDARRAPVGWPGVRLAVIGVALLAAAAQVPGLIATQRVRESQAAAREGDLEASRILAEEAVEAQPWAATPRFQLALVLEAEDRLAGAQAEVEEAIAREETNWRYPLLLARIQAERGDLTTARRTFLRGRELRPLSPSYGPSSPYAQAIFTEAQLERLERE